MAIGLNLHLTEQHEHAHQHTAMCMTNIIGTRTPLWDKKEPHDHAHEHMVLEHSHRHVPDIQMQNPCSVLVRVTAKYFSYLSLVGRELGN